MQSPHSTAYTVIYFLKPYCNPQIKFTLYVLLADTNGTIKNLVKLLIGPGLLYLPFLSFNYNFIYGGTVDLLT